MMSKESVDSEEQVCVTQTSGLELLRCHVIAIYKSNVQAITSVWITITTQMIM
jgi:hypothetical protein